MLLRFVLAAALATATLNACGSDDATGSPDVEPSVATSASSGDQIEAFSGEEICERLSAASVTGDTGLEISRAVPNDAATPQCTYEYTSDTGGVSNLTVASMRSEDVGGLTGTEAFDYVVQINEMNAGSGAETQEVSAGDAAIRISGTSMHLGVVQVGDRVLTLIIPVDDVESDAVDQLIATMATTLN